MTKKTVVAKGESRSTILDIRDGVPVVSFEGDKVVVSQTTPPELTSSAKGSLRREEEGRYPPEKMALLPKTRAEAIEAGAKRFFTGVPCKHGHIAPRMISGTGSVCVECNRLHLAKRTKEQNKDIFAKTNHAKTTAQVKTLLKQARAIVDNQNETEVTDRVEAARQGLRFYFEAKACVKGHVNKVRYTSTGQCVVCHRALCLAWNERKNKRRVHIDNENLMANPTVAVHDETGQRPTQDDE